MTSNQQPQPPTKRPRRYTQGATLTVVVLFTMLILSLIMIVTLRLTLNARTGGIDQKAILQSQYSAESNLALARSKLRDVQTVLTGDGTSNMALPYTTTSDNLDAWMLQFCNKPTGYTLPYDPSDTLQGGSPTSTQICQSDGVSSQSYAILANLITPSGYSNISLDSPPSSGDTISSKTTWWYNYLNTNTAGLSFSVVPEKAVKLGTTYRFYFKPIIVASNTNTLTPGVRKISAQGQANSDWWIQVVITNAFDNALVLNRWTSDNGGWLDDVIKGNAFTNEKYRFYAAKNTVSFLGNVGSAGCNNLSSGNPSAGADCSDKTAGYYAPTTTAITQPASASNTTVNTKLRASMTAMGTSILPNKITNFRAKYLAIPLSTSLQAGATGTDSGGLSIPSTVTRIKIWAGDVNANTLSSYNLTTSSWNEPSLTYQYIEMYSGSSGSTFFSSYRIDSNGAMYLRNSNPWSATNNGTLQPLPSAPIPFNGVIYSDHALIVDGPSRVSASGSYAGDLAIMPPALASFMKLNVTVTGNIYLNTDLTDSNTPCGFDNMWMKGGSSIAQPACPKSTAPINMLALFTPSGNIIMNQTTPAEVTYHAAILASQGSFNVDNYSNIPVKGKRHIVGAVVANSAAGTGHATTYFNKVVVDHGYLNDYSQDVRLKNVLSIPFNPILTSGSWEYHNASTDPKNDDYKALDNLIWKQVKQ